MVNKMFCDECDREIKNEENVVSHRIILKAKTGHKFQILVASKEGTWNDGHLCKTCAINLLKTSTVQND